MLIPLEWKLLFETGVANTDHCYCKLVQNLTHAHVQPSFPHMRKRPNLNIVSGLQRCTTSAEQIFQPVTNLINVGSGGFRWRLALWRGPVRGLNPDGAGWPVGLHRSKSRADEATVVCFDGPLRRSSVLLQRHCSHSIAKWWTSERMNHRITESQTRLNFSNVLFLLAKRRRSRVFLFTKTTMVTVRRLASVMSIATVITALSADATYDKTHINTHTRTSTARESDRTRRRERFSSARSGHASCFPFLCSLTVAWNQTTV